MQAAESTAPCPFCAEQILPTAKKCKHCGEWLDTRARPQGSGVGESGSAGARAVTRGLKEKELHDSARTFFSFLALVVSAIAGYALQSWFAFFGVLFACIVLIGIWYYRE